MSPPSNMRQKADLLELELGGGGGGGAAHVLLAGKTTIDILPSPPRETLIICLSLNVMSAVIYMTVS